MPTGAQSKTFCTFSAGTLVKLDKLMQMQLRNFSADVLSPPMLRSGTISPMLPLLRSVCSPGTDVVRIWACVTLCRPLQVSAWPAVLGRQSMNTRLMSGRSPSVPLHRPSVSPPGKPSAQPHLSAHAGEEAQGESSGVGQEDNCGRGRHKQTLLG